MGVQIELSPEAVAQCVNEVGVGFMFAPAFHPAMRYAGPVRREIGIRTVFNILGPLTNPAGAQTQLLGVAFPELGGIMAEVLGFLGSHHAMIVHGHGGLDEISLSGDTSVWEVRGGEVEEWTLHVEDTGLPETPIEAIRGGTKEENAATMRRVFQGEQGPVRDMVLLNSAGVLMVGDKAESIRKGVEMSAGIIDSGAALAKLDQMIEVTQRLGQPDA